MTGLAMVRAWAALALVLCAALTAHAWGVFLGGLPLTLGGLYWCGRALAQGQRSLRRRRVSRARGSLLSTALPDARTACRQQRGSTHGRAQRPGGLSCPRPHVRRRRRR